MRWFELTLPPTSTLVGVARSTTAATAQLAGLSPETTEDARTCISEAVTNAMNAHAAAGHDDDVQIRLGAGEQQMILEVRDQGGGPPHSAPTTAPTPDLDALTEGGLGIPVMHALADHVEIAPGDDGGTVITLRFAG